MSPAPAPADSEPRSNTSTPLGRKRNHGRKRGDSRKPQTPRDETPVGSEVDTPAGDTEEDSEELFQLLGVDGSAEPVSQHYEKGLLRLSKEGMDAATNKNKKVRARSKNKSRTDTPVDHNESSDPEQTRKAGAGPNTPNTKPRRTRGGKKADVGPLDSSPDAMDVSALSRSLPASFFAENKPKKDDQSSVWEMPTDSPVGAQALNWQQQLQNEDTPSKRSNRSNNNQSEGRRRGGKQGAAAAPPPRPTHDRRQSLDHVPVSNLTKMMAAAVTPASAPAAHAPVSAFDQYIPFHTGFNVHRAPQTPVRTAASRGSPAPAGLPGVISLPIVGDFPRLNKAGGMPLGGPKYAGPTFHNSPASGSLPKPDLDDF